MTQPAAAPPPRNGRLARPAAVALLAAAVVAAVVAVGWRRGRETADPPLPSFDSPYRNTGPDVA